MDREIHWDPVWMVSEDARTEPDAMPDEGTQAGSDSCIICGARQVEGIRICMHLICESCEKEMVSTDVSDARYPYYLYRMRKIFYHINNV